MSFSNHPASAKQRLHPQCKRRNVFYVGPYKTASTSIQHFLADHFAIDERRSDLRKRNPAWKYPFENANHCFWYGRDPSEDDNRPILQEKAKLMEEGENLIVACESYGIPGPTSLPFARALRWMDIDPSCVEIVFHLRSPRIEHWLSHYNQNAKTGKIKVDPTSDSPFKQFVCETSNSNIYGMMATTRIIDTFKWASNFRKAKSFSGDNGDVAVSFPVTIVDMKGVTDADRDVTHTFACDILGVDCTDDGWIVGAEREQKQQNTRDSNIKSDMSDEQRYHMDSLFRVRDCTYRDEIRNDSMVRLLYSQSTWNGCEDGVDYTSHPFKQLRNETFMRDAIRSVMGCEGSQYGDDVSSFISSLRVKPYVSKVDLFSLDEPKQVDAHGESNSASSIQAKEKIPAGDGTRVDNLKQDLNAEVSDSYEKSTNLLAVTCSLIVMIAIVLRKLAQNRATTRSANRREISRSKGKLLQLPKLIERGRKE